jgi:MarR family transcriptional regulator, temperature-dependent positive regulator of motility
MRQDPTTDMFDALVAARAMNLRQLLQAATRRLNAQIAESLRSHGYSDITATHTMLLSNMTLEDDTVTSISQRASVSAQAVGRLVKELEERGYLRTTADDNDARRRPILLTLRGRKLMEASFAILGDIEEQLTSKVGARSIVTLRQCLLNVAAD